MAIANTRKAMTNFWSQTSAESRSSMEDMMFDSRASELQVHEKPEVLGMLPPLQGKDVLELGCGIGRFTGDLAARAKSVIAVDFIEKYLAQNRQQNDGSKNLRFVLSDVRDLKLEDNSLDVVFCNWLLMYLDNAEVTELVNRILKWLRPGGYFFFRESCYHKSGDAARKFNPTKYRDPAMYNSLMMQPYLQNGDEVFRLETIFTRPVMTYIKMKENAHQLCWLMTKSAMDPSATSHGFKTFQEFLDNSQYSRNGILRYERIFGTDYVSTGGEATTQEFVARLELQPGQTVLDVGCGIGGSAFYMAQTYEANVLGIDLSANMIEIAYEKLAEKKDKRVQFEVGDATRRDFEPNTFDVIYSRDTILHIDNKEELFQSFLRWLKPNGKLLISDYCCTDDVWSDNYQAYVKQRGYRLLSVRNYGKLLESVGFEAVDAQDRTEQFRSTIQRELKAFEAQRMSFVTDFSEKDFQDIVNGWSDKITRIEGGDQKWGLFYAVKGVQK